MDLAGGAAEDDSPGGPDLGAMLFGRMGGLRNRKRLARRVDFVLPGADFADRLVAIEAGAPGVDAQFAYFAQFLASGGLQCRFAAGRLLGKGLVHP